ncbi:MAG: hypothetical protein HY321_02285 [Armatimonadetes bacterium]|nr:hypothetical protein [Armatimonadota bacterium]
MPRALLWVPLVWSLIGFSAATSRGIRDDFGLLVAGLAGSTTLWWRDRKAPGE